MDKETRSPEALRAYEARLRTDLDKRIGELSERVRRELHAGHPADDGSRTEAANEINDRLTALREDLEARFAGERRETDARFETERREWQVRLDDARLEHQAALAALQAELREDRIETFTRLARAVRRLDAAASLSAILEALAKGAVAEAARVAILIVEPDALRVWGHFGFAAGHEPTDVTSPSSHLVAAAISRQQPAIVTAKAAESDTGLPTFMRPPEGQAGLITPLVVGGEVVCVMYAEGLSSARPATRRPCGPRKLSSWRDMPRRASKTSHLSAPSTCSRVRPDGR